MLRSAAALLLILSACTTDADGPETSAGELTRVRDQAFACDDTANDASWACTIDITIAGDQLTSVGIHNDGTSNGPRATATLSPIALAEIGALIETMPMSQEDPGVRCGGAPLATRDYTIQFDSVGERLLNFQSVESGPARELENYVTGLITSIDTCQGNDKISFTSCTPRIEAKQ
jgi:hypothetical protein